MANLNPRYLAWEGKMLRTITIGHHISVQGMFIGKLDNGKIMVRVGEKTFVGRPVSSAVSAG